MRSGDGDTPAPGGPTEAVPPPVVGTPRQLLGAAFDPLLPPLRIAVQFDTGKVQIFTLPPGAFTEDLKYVLERRTRVPAGVCSP